MNKASPTLPAACSDQDARAASLESARDSYRYDTSYHGMLFLQKLPFFENFPPRYLAKGAEVELALSANRAASSVGAWTQEEFAGLLGREPDASPLAPFSRMYATLPEPRAMPHWRENWCFAWQRLAGPAPVLLRRARELPPGLTLGDAELSATLGRPARVAEALERGALYAADYAMFLDVPRGVVDGAQKYLTAPVALFYADPKLRGGLLPVAILLREPGRAPARYLPSDPAWPLAKLATQIADENLQGVIVHMGWCHMITQRFVLAMHRQLAAEHPLHVLMSPHFELTLAVNQVARKSVISPGGVQDRLLGPTLEAQIGLLEASLRQIDLAQLDPNVDFERRGVADSALLPHYPFRDDSLPLWNATRAYVDAYVRLYYASDADVVADTELAAFLREIGSSEGGRLPRLVQGVSLARVEDVVALVTRILFRATTYHAAINDSNFDWGGYAPNMSTAAFGPVPPPGSSGDDAALAAMLPSAQVVWETISATYQVAQLHTNRLGVYPAGHFVDARVAPLVTAFQKALEEIESETLARNALRPIPYEYLIPSRITASINA